MFKGVILLALLSIYSYSFTLTDKDIDRDWLRLLHYRDGESEIGDPNFFLSKSGKTDPLKELNATIRAILSSDDRIFCRFPARVKWIYKHRPDIVKRVPYRSCKELDEILKAYAPRRAYLIFPTANINSPASMYGHTFLAITDKKGLMLMSNAINFFADSNDKNGIIFAYKGLFGKYKGRYSALPYYQKIKEYSNMEKRDIWEYELNLTPTEIEKLLTHMYEIRNSYSDYYFFTRNCSYNLLWMLEIARDSDLVDRFSYKAIPIDTIRVVKEAGFIANSRFRASKATKIRALLEMKETLKGEQKEAIEMELEVAKLQLKRQEREIDKKSYIKELLRLSKKRSKLPKVPKPSTKTPTDPVLGHKSSRVDIGVEDSGEIFFGYKPAFHDSYDLDEGFKAGAYIDFFRLLFRYDKDLVKLERFSFVDISSYALRDEILKPISWGVRFGLDRFRDREHFELSTKVGVSFGEDRLFYYLIATPSLHLRAGIHFQTALRGGFVANRSNEKVGAHFERGVEDGGVGYYRAEGFYTHKVDRDNAINFKLQSGKIEGEKEKRRFQINLFHYF